MSVLLLAGSPSPSSRSSRLLDVIARPLRARGLATARLAVRDLPAEPLIAGDASDPHIAGALTRVARADAVVIATPVYKAAYSGVLKLLLDLLPQDGLRGKVVLPIACGGGAAHTLALDYALRPVLASLAPAQILASVYAVESQISITRGDEVLLDAPLERRLLEGADALACWLAASSRVRIEAGRTEEVAP